MKSAVLTLSVLFISLSASADSISSVEHAKEVACEELSKQNYEVDGGCLTEITLDRETKSSYWFFAQDVSGDCGARVIVNKKSGMAVSKISCE